MGSLEQAGEPIRENIIDGYIDGLIHEVILDKANDELVKPSLPSHIKPVQALCVVTHEEYMDACSIINSSNGDVSELSLLASMPTK